MANYNQDAWRLIEAKVKAAIAEAIAKHEAEKHS